MGISDHTEGAGGETAPIEHLSAREGYERWATIYDDEDNPLIAIEQPRVEHLLGDVCGLDVADLGCGTGRHAAWLAQAGARVRALDFSEAMLARARQKAAGKVAFLVHDLARPLPLTEASFDRVLSGLVIDHIEDLYGLFREMRRICRPEGFAVVSVMHPAMMLRGVQARFRDPQSGREIRPASQPHQISDYIMAAVEAGFALDYVGEAAVDDSLANRMERARRYLGWPMLFLMRLRPSPS
jgi:SAM-dependent methyltransferase